MPDINDIKISAYLSPHPMDEDTYLEEEWISWLPGYIKGETEEGLPSHLNEDNIELYKKIESFTSTLFKKALARMWPLLEEHYFKKIFINIDYPNNSNSSALAGYLYTYSNPGKGIYCFSLDQYLLSRYSAYINEKIDSLPNMNIWEHELIHLLDHWEILKASAFADSDLPQNNMQYYMLKYREEGIANLLDLLDGKIKAIGSRKKAKEVFFANCNKIQKTLSSLEKTSDKVRREIYTGYDFYEAGPWIILDMLKEIPMVTELIEIDELENKIINGENIDEELKLKIIKYAFYINSEWFNGRIGNYLK